MKRKLILTTNIPEFLYHLGTEIENAISREFPAEGGRIILLMLGYDHTHLYSNVSQDKIFVEIKGRFITGEQFKPVSLMTFDIVRKADKKIKVQADCREQAIAGYFDELIAGFSKRWQPGTETKYGKQQSTDDKIQRLREFRIETMRDKKQIPKLTIACRQIPVDRKTVKAHAPELLRRWNDPEFRE